MDLLSVPPRLLVDAAVGGSVEFCLAVPGFFTSRLVICIIIVWGDRNLISGHGKEVYTF